MASETKKELKFIHITKTAGTSIEQEGRKHNILWGIYHREYGFHHEYFPRKPQELREKYDWFMVVRNPYDRVISEYYFLTNSMKIKTQKTPEHLNEFITTWMKNNKDNKLNHPIYGRINGDHFSPQHLYLDSTVKIHILRFENLKSEFETLMTDYNLPVTLSTHANKTLDKVLTVQNISKENIEFINDYYKEDFKQFGYKMCDPQTKAETQ